MPYIGNPIYQSAFVVDQFTGNGSTTAFTMSVAPAGVTNVLVAVSGVLQDPSTYGVVGNTITFSAAPPSGTGNISCRYLGVPVTGVTTTAYRTVTEFTATAGQTTFTPPSYNVGFINVYLNGVLLGSADYTATNGTTVVLAIGASAGNLLTVESFQVSSVLNAIPNTAGAVTSSNIQSGVTINFADGSASTPSITNDGDTNTGMFFPAADTIAFSEGGVESMRVDSSGNVNIGATSNVFGSKLGVTSSAAFPLAVITSTIAGTALNKSTDGAGNHILMTSNNSFNYGVIGVSSANGTSTGDVFTLGYTPSGGAAATNVLNWSSAGQVTMPLQPAFRAFTGTSFTGSTVVIFNSTQFNTGGHYSTSTGRFTAPVAGRYFFTFYLLSANGYSGSFWGGLRQNGTSLAFAEIDWPGNYRTIATSTVVQLAAGDYVDVLIAQGSTYAGGGSVGEWSAFSGYLLG
jgi:hypothetical protein